jgi:hypothetical protein
MYSNCRLNDFQFHKWLNAPRYTYRDTASQQYIWKCEFIFRLKPSSLSNSSIYNRQSTQENDQRGYNSKYQPPRQPVYERKSLRQKLFSAGRYFGSIRAKTWSDFKAREKHDGQCNEKGNQIIAEIRIEWNR